MGVRGRGGTLLPAKASGPPVGSEDAMYFLPRSPTKPRAASPSRTSVSHRSRALAIKSLWYTTGGCRLAKRISRRAVKNSGAITLGIMFSLPIRGPNARGYDQNAPRKWRPTSRLPHFIRAAISLFTSASDTPDASNATSTW
jgi:hypothetical protein